MLASFFSSFCSSLVLNFVEPARNVFYHASQATGLSISQLSFVTAQLVNCPVVALTRKVSKGNARHIYGTVSTLGLLTLAYGRDVEQFVYAGALVYLFMRFFPKRCGYLTWGTIFTYQIYLHYERSSEAAWNAGNIDFTGSFMMATLRLISLAMDYQDGVTGKKTKHSFSKFPTLLEYTGYLTGLGGILVGPHFYYDEYLRYANNQGEYENLNSSSFPSTVGPGIKAFMSSVFSVVIYFQFGQVITNRAAILTLNDARIGMWGKLFIGFIANVEYRLKLYFAWHLEECALILSGFGFSGYSKYDERTPVWTKAVSSAMIECEAPPSVAIAVVKWNRHTGMWLRNYVYDRIPMGGLAALLVTQTICGLWHGFSSSFILFFSHSALVIYCSRILYRIQTKHMPKDSRPYTDFLHSLFTMFMLNYICGGYNVVSLAAVMDWWRSVNYGKFLSPPLPRALPFEHQLFQIVVFSSNLPFTFLSLSYLLLQLVTVLS